MAERKVTYKEPSSYFNEEMKKEVRRIEKEKAKANANAPKKKGK